MILGYIANNNFQATSIDPFFSHGQNSRKSPLRKIAKKTAFE